MTNQKHILKYDLRGTKHDFKVRGQNAEVRTAFWAKIAQNAVVPLTDVYVRLFAQLINAAASRFFRFKVGGVLAKKRKKLGASRSNLTEASPVRLLSRCWPLAFSPCHANL
jgi:hypothetical protein